MASISKLAYYRSYLDNADILEPAQFGRLMKAIGDYGFKGIEPDLSDDKMLLLAWVNIRPSLEVDMANKDSGARGGRGRKPEQPSPVPTLAREASEDAPETSSQEQEYDFDFIENNQSLVLETGVSESPKGGFKLTKSDVDDDVDVDEDVEGDVDVPPSGPTPPGQPVPVTVASVGNFLWDHGLALDNDGMKRLTTSLASRLLGMDYLDYAFDYLSKKPYGAPGGGKRSWQSMSEAERNNLFFKAVTTWTDMEQGYSDSLKKKQACGASSSDPPPLSAPTCHFCGGKLQVGGGLLACRKCGGYVIHDASGWRLEPFPDVSLSQGFRDSMRKGA
ncbi:MAG: DUF6291 domain-containing protein [Treponema sp.]|nr:DUF6291 domain-containing protein [Treponema sp.]